MPNSFPTTKGRRTGSIGSSQAKKDKIQSEQIHPIRFQNHRLQVSSYSSWTLSLISTCSVEVSCCASPFGSLSPSPATLGPYGTTILFHLSLRFRSLPSQYHLKSACKQQASLICIKIFCEIVVGSLLCTGQQVQLNEYSV
jgi:hypothetical protein